MVQRLAELESVSVTSVSLILWKRKSQRWLTTTRELSLWRYFSINSSINEWITYFMRLSIVESYCRLTSKLKLRNITSLESKYSQWLSTLCSTLIKHMKKESELWSRVGLTRRELFLPSFLTHAQIGANATMLDIDFGTWPYVTSSNASIGGNYAFNVA